MLRGFNPEIDSSDEEYPDRPQGTASAPSDPTVKRTTFRPPRTHQLNPKLNEKEEHQEITPEEMAELNRLEEEYTQAMREVNIALANQHK